MIHSDKQLTFVLEVLRNTSREVLGITSKLNKQNSATESRSFALLLKLRTCYSHTSNLCHVIYY